MDFNEAFRSVHVALDLGMNFIDTSPFYGRGMSECLLGVALRGVPRDRYYLGTKLGRYGPAQFDFSPQRVVGERGRQPARHGRRSSRHHAVPRHRVRGHGQIVEETLPALRKIQKQGKVRFVGVSGYPMKIFRYVLDRTDLDVILSYNHYTLQNTMLADLVPYLKGKGVGIMNAAPFSARLLTNAPLPPWHKATPRGPGHLPAAPPSTATPAAWTSPSWPCSIPWPTPTWRPASSARPTPRTSASGSNGPTQPMDSALAERGAGDPASRSTTGFTSKAGPRTTTPS